LTASLSAPPPRPASGNHQGRKSRTLSLITPRHIAQDLPPLLDGPAAHYQDPNARLKLREYLTSAQKFDEAIEFGFPPLTDSRAMQTSFLADDDKSSVYSDASDAEPESPKTPVLVDHPKQHHMAATAAAPTTFTRQHMRMPTDPFVSELASREMTVRMTLTRPDLRADEGQIYGWQQQQQQQQPSGLGLGHSARPSFSAPRKSMSPGSRDCATPPLTEAEIAARVTIQRKLDAIEMECQADDKGVMRRIWKRVRGQ
jgi:hypothetical protein